VYDDSSTQSNFGGSTKDSLIDGNKRYEEPTAKIYEALQGLATSMIDEITHTISHGADDSSGNANMDVELVAADYDIDPNDKIGTRMEGWTGWWIFNAANEGYLDTQGKPYIAQFSILEGLVMMKDCGDQKVIETAFYNTTDSNAVKTNRIFGDVLSLNPAGGTEIVTDTSDV